MAAISKISWTDSTWQPTLGCSVASRACSGCYAKRDIWRMMHNPHPAVAARTAGLVRYDERTGRYEWTGRINVDEAALDQPLRWEKPRRIFVDSMSDLFHDHQEDATIVRVFQTILACRLAGRRHAFQILTKRPHRMARILARLDIVNGDRVVLRDEALTIHREWPNCWFGTSAEDQRTLDLRIGDLMQVNGRRFLSLEPLLGDLGAQTLDYAIGSGVHWVIVGGESGTGARGMDLGWARAVVARCLLSAVPVYVKQLGCDPYTEPGPLSWPISDLAGRKVEDFPEDLRVQQMPEGLREEDFAP